MKRDFERARSRGLVDEAIARRNISALQEAMAIHDVVCKATSADDACTEVSIVAHEFRALAEEALASRNIEKLRVAIDGIVGGELTGAARLPSARLVEEDGVGEKAAAKWDRPTLLVQGEFHRRNGGERTVGNGGHAEASTVEWYKYCVVRPDDSGRPLPLERHELSSVGRAKRPDATPLSPQDELIRQAIVHRLEAAIAAARHGRRWLARDRLDDDSNSWHDVQA
jgi:hypothetical protein